MRELKCLVEQTCENTARGFGAQAEVIFTTEYPVLNNDNALTERTIDKISALIGKENVYKMDAPSLGADDFAFFCQAADCCYFNIGCRGETQGDDQILHSAYLAPDERCIENALRILCEIIM